MHVKVFLIKCTVSIHTHTPRHTHTEDRSLLTKVFCNYAEEILYQRTGAFYGLAHVCSQNQADAHTHRDVA